MEQDQQIAEAIKMYLGKRDYDVKEIMVNTPFYTIRGLHGFDEYDMALLVLDLEEHFDIRCNDEDVGAVQTVSDMVSLIATAMDAKANGKQEIFVSPPQSSSFLFRSRGGQRDKPLNFKTEEKIYNSEYF
jgi:acyl carrier protein